MTLVFTCTCGVTFKAAMSAGAGFKVLPHCHNSRFWNRDRHRWGVTVSEVGLPPPMPNTLGTSSTAYGQVLGNLKWRR